MDDKKLRFLAINMLVTVVALGIIISAIFIDDQKTKMITMFTAIGILVVQKILEIIMIKETRKDKYCSSYNYSFCSKLFRV